MFGQNKNSLAYNIKLLLFFFIKVRIQVIIFILLRYQPASHGWFVYIHQLPTVFQSFLAVISLCDNTSQDISKERAHITSRKSVNISIGDGVQRNEWNFPGLRGCMCAMHIH